MKVVAIALLLVMAVSGICMAGEISRVADKIYDGSYGVGADVTLYKGKGLLDKVTYEWKYDYTRDDTTNYLVVSLFSDGLFGKKK